MRAFGIALLALLAVSAVADAAKVHIETRINSELSPSSVTAVATNGAADVTVGPVTIITEQPQGLAAASAALPSTSVSASQPNSHRHTAGPRSVPQSVSASTLSSALLSSPLSLPVSAHTSASTQPSGSSTKSALPSVLSSTSSSAAASGSQRDAGGIMCMWDGVPLRCKGVTKGVCCVKTKTCCKDGYRCDPHGQGKCIRTPTILIKPVIVINQPDCCGKNGGATKTGAHGASSPNSQSAGSGASEAHGSQLKAAKPSMVENPVPVKPGAPPPAPPPPPPPPPPLPAPAPNVRSVPAVQVPASTTPASSNHQEESSSDDGEDSNGKKDDDGVVMNLTNVNTINKRCSGDQTPSKDHCSDGSIPNLDSGDLGVAGQQPPPQPSATF